MYCIFLRIMWDLNNQFSKIKLMNGIGIIFVLNGNDKHEKKLKNKQNQKIKLPE